MPPVRIAQFRRSVAVFVALALSGCAAEQHAPAVAPAEPMMTETSTAPLTPEQQRVLLAPYRARLDVLDDQIVALLGKRFDVIREVAELKAEHGIAPVQPDRIEEVVARARAKAEHAGVDPKLVEQIYRFMIDEAIKFEDDYAHNK